MKQRPEGFWTDHKIYYLYADRDELIAAGADPDSIFEDLNDRGLSQATLNISDAIQLIPHGDYCYSSLGVDSQGKQRIKCCPFWDKIESFPDQSNGYCHFRKRGDFQDLGFGLLWDQCKECGVNEYNQDYED
jgi:hypothetical protein